MLFSKLPQTKDYYGLYVIARSPVIRATKQSRVKIHVCAIEPEIAASLIPLRFIRSSQWQ